MQSARYTCSHRECEYQCLFEALSREDLGDVFAVIRIIQVEPELQLSAYESEYQIVSSNLHSLPSGI